MGIFAIIGTAFALATDAFVVSIASSFAMKGFRVKNAFRAAFLFGLFQAVMPVVGWLCGRSVRGFIIGVDHWIAFVLLSAIGVKMIFEARRMGTERENGGNLGLYVLLLLSVATSIDALVVGFGFAFLGVPILVPVITIGIVTFALSLVGVLVGSKMGHFLERKMETLGGTVLIGIGLKILIEHLVLKP